MSPAPHRIIYTHGGGRLGNQVVRFAHWIAWALERGAEVEVRDLAFWPHAKYFATWQAHAGCVFPLRPDGWDEVARERGALPEYLLHRLEWRIQHLVQRMGRHMPRWQAIGLDVAAGEALDLTDAGFMDAVRRHRVTTFAGWRIANWDLLARHETAVRNLFFPAADFAGPARMFVNQLRRRHGFLIGVLIRQSDYREWDGGRHYFPTSHYVRWIQQALQLYAGQQPAAIVASEERQDAALFAGLPIYEATGNPGGEGHWFENWAELSLCDVVISAPSTFSATAAFVGGAPLWPVVRADQSLEPSQIIRDGLPGAARHPDFGRAVK
jgi:hypothetical protein